MNRVIEIKRKSLPARAGTHLKQNHPRLMKGIAHMHSNTIWVKEVKGGN